jgi:hypothetical protein
MAVDLSHIGRAASFGLTLSLSKGRGRRVGASKSSILRQAQDEDFGVGRIVRAQLA